MRISSRLVYQIVSFSPAAMRVCKFRKHGQKYRIVSWNTVPCEQGGESAALRKALEDNGGQISGCLILTGSMESVHLPRCAAQCARAEERSRI